MPPPPKPLAELPERVELLRIRLPVSPLKSAPPIFKAELPEIVELEMVRVPIFAAPPPKSLAELLEITELLEIVELVTVAIPEL